MSPPQQCSGLCQQIFADRLYQDGVSNPRDVLFQHGLYQFIIGDVRRWASGTGSGQPKLHHPILRYLHEFDIPTMGAQLGADFPLQHSLHIFSIRTVSSSI